MGKSPHIPDPGQAAASGIQADLQMQPYEYFMNAGSTLGIPMGGFDFTGLGQADVAAKVSDQMAQTLLSLQTEKSPAIIRQRIAELRAADPQGYAARQQLFSAILQDAEANPDRPVAAGLQNEIQTQLAKGAGFDDAKQEQQVRDQVRGQQYGQGITMGNAPARQEATAMVNAGESLRNQREQNALNLLQSGASPQDVQYRRFQQALSNLGAFQAGQTPEAQFRQVSGAANGPVQLTGMAPQTNTFNPNAAGQGMQNALGIYGGQWQWANSQANPWLAGLSTTGSAFGTLAQINPSWFGGTPAGSVGMGGYGNYWTPGAGTSNPGWGY